MRLTIDNQLVGLAELRDAWQDPVTVNLSDDARRRVAESNELIADVVAGGEQVYGVNTGFGQLAQVRISDDELAHLQEIWCALTLSAWATIWATISFDL